MRAGYASLIGFLTSLSVAQAQEGWVLYAPSSTPDGARPEGARYLEELVQAYGTTFYATETSLADDPAAIKRECVNRLKAAAQQLAYTLNGFSFDLTLSVQGTYPPYDDVACRITASNDLNVTIEIRED